MTVTSALEPFDGGETAGLYSQLAGVLAGIAFAALLLYLTRASKEFRDTGDQAVAANLTAAVAALILCAASYAVLAGAPKATGSAALAAIVYGLPFGTSVLLLFYTLAIIFLQRPALADIGRVSVYVVAAGGPVWVLSYATMATMTAVAVRCEPTCGSRPPLVIPVVVGLILIAVLIVASYGAIRVRRLRPARLRPEVGARRCRSAHHFRGRRRVPGVSSARRALSAVGRAADTFAGCQFRRPPAVRPKRGELAARPAGERATAVPDHQIGMSRPWSDSGRGPVMRRSASLMGWSLMEASRRLIRPFGANSHSSLP